MPHTIWQKILEDCGREDLYKKPSRKEKKKEYSKICKICGDSFKTEKRKKRICKNCSKEKKTLHYVKIKPLK